MTAFSVATVAQSPESTRRNPLQPTEMRPHLELPGLISSSICALRADLSEMKGASFSHPIGITDAVLGVHGGAADVVRRTSY